MRIPKSFKYILYIVVLFGFLVAASWTIFMLKLWADRTFAVIPLSIGYSVIYIVFGFFLGIEHLFKEFSKQGEWSVNTLRLMMMGIPSGIFAFYLVLVYTLPIRFPYFLANTNLFFEFSGIIFGYTIMTSFYKKQTIPTKSD